MLAPSLSLPATSSHRSLAKLHLLWKGTGETFQHEAKRRQTSAEGSDAQQKVECSRRLIWTAGRVTDRRVQVADVQASLSAATGRERVSEDVKPHRTAGRRSKKRQRDLPVTAELVTLFLSEYAWLAHSRHKRDRLAYRIIEWQANELSYLRLVAEAGSAQRKWAERVR